MCFKKIEMDFVLPISSTMTTTMTTTPTTEVHICGETGEGASSAEMGCYEKVLAEDICKIGYISYCVACFEKYEEELEAESEEEEEEEDNMTKLQACFTALSLVTPYVINLGGGSWELLPAPEEEEESPAITQLVEDTIAAWDACRAEGKRQPCYDLLQEKEEEGEGDEVCVECETYIKFEKENFKTSDEFNFPVPAGFYCEKCCIRLDEEEED